jgi:hypothetical protein
LVARAVSVGADGATVPGPPACEGLPGTSLEDSGTHHAATFPNSVGSSCGLTTGISSYEPSTVASVWTSRGHPQTMAPTCISGPASASRSSIGASTDRDDCPHDCATAQSARCQRLLRAFRKNLAPTTTAAPTTLIGLGSTISPCRESRGEPVCEQASGQRFAIA